MDLLAETTKQTEIFAAAERRIHYEHELAARLAQRKRAEAEKSSLEAAEKAEFLRIQAELEQAVTEKEEFERAEAEKAEALMLAEIKAKRLEAEKLKAERQEAERIENARIEAEKAEATGKAPMNSDPRVDNLEKSVEEIKADQKEFKEALKQQADSQKETKSMLDMILDELRKSKS